MFPPIPLGVGGANQIGGKFSFPGTYDVRESTLRAVFVDIASDLGDQGFRWIFVYHAHGAPTHRRALDEAADYFRATYRGHMVNLWEIGAANAQKRERVSALYDVGKGAYFEFIFYRRVKKFFVMRTRSPDLLAIAMNCGFSIVLFLF
jgi:creatinine amidohydrolase/Fe(II)-dependent formamide hydrolase-like protein